MIPPYPRRPRRRRRIPRVLLLVLLAAAGAACAARHEGARPPRAWLAELDGIGAQALSEQLAGRLVCVDHAATEPGVRPDGCLVMPTAWVAESRVDTGAARRLIARAAHLALHPPGFAASDPAAHRDCAAWVATLLEAEARALAVEARLRAKLRVPLAPGEADAHLAALAAAYSARCDHARATP